MKTFVEYPEITSQTVRFNNRYGIELVGDLYLPVDYQKQMNAAVVVSGPFGAVKEQAAGLYAQELAKYGFVTIAFDPSFTGESGGKVRDVSDPSIYSEDFSAAVDFLGTLSYVDRDRIGVQAICGLAGMALTAASVDTRIKAIATASMYDMADSMGRGYQNSYSATQRQALREYVSQQRWVDVDAGNVASGDYHRGWHELAFDENGAVVSDDHLFPATLPEDADEVTKAFFDYYCTPRGYHERSINSNRAWTSTTPMSFYAFPLYDQIAEISPRPVMFITGDKAHSRYHSEKAYARAKEPKQLVVVPDADHVDLYDQKDKIPFDQLVAFFQTNLK